MSTLRFIDVNAHLTNYKYSGFYLYNFHEPPIRYHKADIKQVLERSWEAGLDKIIVCARNLVDSRDALKFVKSNKRLFCTVGCDPNTSSQFEEKPDLFVQELEDLIKLGKKKVVAIGQCGVNFYQEYYYPINAQLRCFEYQVKLSKLVNLPLIILSQGEKAPELILNLIRKYPGVKGVVRHRDLTEDGIKQLVNEGFYIGLDTWSFKSEEDAAVIKTIPLDRIVFQTDCPDTVVQRGYVGYFNISKENLELLSTANKKKWKPGFMVNGRSEPCNIRQILDMTAFVVNMDKNDLAKRVYSNTINLFFPGENT